MFRSVRYAISVYHKKANFIRLEAMKCFAGLWKIDENRMHMSITMLKERYKYHRFVRPK